MKIKILAAFLIAASLIAFVSCKWFQSNKQMTSSLIGKWKVDSIHFRGDSVPSSQVVICGNSINSTNTKEPEYEFTKDSFIFSSRKQSMASSYLFNKADSLLTIKDSTVQTYHFNKLNDSLISLTDKDSTILFLKRK